jgi:HSP20 family protein
MPRKSVIPAEKKDIRVEREEFNPLYSLRREMNSLFDNFFRGFEMEPFKGHFGTFSPSVDVQESAKDIKVTAELPGVDDKDVEVSLSKDSMTIRGEKQEEKEDRGKDFYRMERSFGSFSRTIPLPAEVDTDKAKAEFKKGVLTVTLPKTSRAIKETKNISVKAK